MRLQFGGARLQWACVDVVFAHQSAIADGQQTIIHLCGEAAPRVGLKLFDAGQGRGLRIFAIAREDGVGERMFAALLGCCGQPQQLVFAQMSQRYDVGDGGFAFSQCPGFIEDHGVHIASMLKRLRVADENASARGDARADHESCWRGQPQSARTGDHHHADGGDQPACEISRQ